MASKAFSSSSQVMLLSYVAFNIWQERQRRLQKQAKKEAITAAVVQDALNCPLAEEKKDPPAVIHHHYYPPLVDPPYRTRIQHASTELLVVIALTSCLVLSMVSFGVAWMVLGLSVGALLDRFASASYVSPSPLPLPSATTASASLTATTTTSLPPASLSSQTTTTTSLSLSSTLSSASSSATSTASLSSSCPSSASASAAAASSSPVSQVACPSLAISPTFASSFVSPPSPSSLSSSPYVSVSPVASSRSENSSASSSSLPASASSPSLALPSSSSSSLHVSSHETSLPPSDSSPSLSDTPFLNSRLSSSSSVDDETSLGQKTDSEPLSSVALYERLDELETSKKPHEVSRLLAEMVKEECDDWQLLYRAARNKFVMVKEVLSSKEEKKACSEEGLRLVQRALQCPGAEQSAQCHKWFAIMSSDAAEYNGTKARIAAAPVFQQHVLRALEIDPLDPDLHHMMGRFCYELANMSWATKRLVSMTLGALPEVTLKDALGFFSRARELKPNWIRNDIWLVKALRDYRKTDEARALLEQMLLLPPEGAEDREVLAEANTLII